MHAHEYVDVFTEHVLDDDARYCLLYAACCGGHVNLVKRWYTPGTDINNPLVLVGHLNNCQFKYPLYAACQGGSAKLVSLFRELSQD